MQHGDKAWRARFIVIKWRLIDANVENIYQRGEAEGTSPPEEKRRETGGNERAWFRGGKRGEDGKICGEERDRVSIENPGK